MIDIAIEAIIEPPSLTVTEVMPYPIGTVWLAQTEGLYVKQWWAPTDYENVEVDLTLEPGGTWRVLQRDPQGNHYAFYGKVERVERERLLVITLISELYPDAEISVSQEFVHAEAGTVVLSTYTFGSTDDLNVYLALGGPERLTGASARLDTLLAQLTA